MEGTVVSWDAEEGWGVVRTPALAGDVWAHFSAIEGEGFVALVAGQAVELDVVEVPAGQDGYAYRATSVRAVG